jgi:hypothetical protein
MQAFGTPMTDDRRHERRLLLAAAFSLVATTAISLFLVHPVVDSEFGRSRYSILPWLPVSTVVLALNVAVVLHPRLARRLGSFGALLVVAGLLPLASLAAAIAVRDDHRIQNEAADVFRDHTAGARARGDLFIRDRAGERVTMCAAVSDFEGLCLRIDLRNPPGREVEARYRARISSE